MATFNFSDKTRRQIEIMQNRMRGASAEEVVQRALELLEQARQALETKDQQDKKAGEGQCYNPL